MNRIPMTVKGAEKLRGELDYLKNVKRPAITKAIAEARAHGDLKENAEYHAAREQQGINEAHIADLETKLSYAQIIDVTEIPHTGKVIFGVKVDLVNLDTDEEITYQIVGEGEADINNNQISVNTPIARALIGKHENDVVTVKAPKGEMEYEIIAVRHEL
ncbi:MAG: transcription elongation factor GreA [Pseudomonadota bacterium]